MTSPILQTVTRWVTPAIVAYSWYLLLSGHYSPGGGFVAGLMTALAVIVWTLAFGPDVFRRRWLRGVSAGLLLAAGTGIGAILAGEPFLTHALVSLGGLKLSTSLLFEMGVYLTVASAVLAAVQALTGVRR
ncbi:MAG: MnhB domain-containing protein [Armatimonadota bacterium]|nr:MnhB domain-containing protein [Armatimonadota bacterium]MDR5696597.1 MnhB domain-containing protein [Armatimonadota bacterium]